MLGGFRIYEMYFDSYGTGQKVLITIPTWNDISTARYNETDVSIVTSECDWYNPNYTWFITGANRTTYDWLVANSDLTSLYYIPDILNGNTSRLLWLNESNYIEIKQNGMLLSWFNASMTLANNNLYTLPSYNAFLSGTTSPTRRTVVSINSFAPAPGIKYNMNVYLATGTNPTSLSALQAFYDTAKLAPDGDHPYENGGYNDPDSPIGGDGPFTDETGVVDPAHIPSLSAVATGFCSLYNPTLQQTKALATYMWNNTDDFVNTLTKLVSDPLSTILGLHIVPIQPTSGNTEYIQLGNVSTNIQARKLTLTNFQVFNCGNVNITKYFNAYLDFAPYTKVMLYLPFIGYVNLDTDQIMDKTINVRYLIDFLTGACTAVVSVGGNDLYQYSGNCSYSIPITGSDLKSTISSIMSITGTIAAVGYSAYSGGGMTPSTAVTAISNTINDAISMKPNIEHSGSLGGSNGFLGVRHPYLIITRPTQCIPANLDKYEGYPLYAYKNFGSLIGYTVVENPQLVNISATTDELTEILSLLRSGVIF